MFIQEKNLKIFNCGPQTVFMPSKLIVRPARWYEFDMPPLDPLRGPPIKNLWIRGKIATTLYIWIRSTLKEQKQAFWLGVRFFAVNEWKKSLAFFCVKLEKKFSIIVKSRCHMRFQRAFTARCCDFKVITLVWANLCNFFENATASSKRTLKTRVATRL